MFTGFRFTFTCDRAFGLALRIYELPPMTKAFEIRSCKYPYRLHHHLHQLPVPIEGGHVQGGTSAEIIFIALDLHYFGLSATHNTFARLCATHNTFVRLCATHNTFARPCATHDTFVRLYATHDTFVRLCATHDTLL